MRYDYEHDDSCYASVSHSGVGYGGSYKFSHAYPQSHAPQGLTPSGVSGPISVALGVTKIEVGEPNFNQYAFVDVAAELQKAPSLPETKRSWGAWLDDISDRINSGINSFVLDTKVDLDNPLVQQIRGQNQIANEVIGMQVHPGGEEAQAMTKGLAGVLGGPAAMLVDMEMATNTDNSGAQRLLAGFGVGTSIVVGGVILDGVVDAAKVYSSKGRLKAAKLPTTGKIRFVPERGYNSANPIPKGNKGYKDRFGNEWVKGPSRTPGQPFEWDVQLPKHGGDSLFRKLSPDGKHVNVTLDGRISH